MAERAKHAFGALENIETAKSQGKINEFDILFVKDANGKPYIGWLDSQGETVIVNQNLDAEIDTLESEIAKKADSDKVEEKIDKAVLDVIDIANQYTDQQIESKIAEATSGVVEIVEF